MTWCKHNNIPICPECDEEAALQAKLEQAERAVRGVLDALGPDALSVRENGGPENIYASLAVSVAQLQRKRATPESGALESNPLAALLLAKHNAAAESALAAAQGALRRCRNLTHLQHCDIGSVRWVGEEVGRIVDEALAAEPRAAPPALPAELSGKGEQRRPTIEELEAILREPDGTYEVHILPNGEVHSRRILKAVEPEPGEAKKEDGAPPEVAAAEPKP